MTASKANSRAVSPASSSGGTVDFNRLTLQSPSRIMMSQVTEVHMEEEEENDDVLVIDEAATPAHANAEIVVVSAPIKPTMTDKEKIDAMILDENVTVEQMLNSNIVLPTLSNSAVEDMTDEEDLLAETPTKNKGREGCDAHQENLILVNETVNSSAKSAAQNRDLDSTVPSQWSSRLQDSNIHFGGLSNFQPKDIAKEKTPEVVEQVQESSIQTLIEHHRKDHNVEAVVVESAGFGVWHQTNDPDMSSDATHCSPVVNSDKEKNQSSGCEAAVCEILACIVPSNVNSSAAEDQTPVSIPEVNIFSEISENSKPSRSSHFRRKKGSSKAGLVSSGGISKKGSTHRVKPAYLMPKQELEDTIPLNSPTPPTHSTPDSGLGSPGIEIIEPVVPDTTAQVKNVQATIDGAEVDVEEDEEEVELMLTDEITVLNCSGGENMEGDSEEIPATHQMSPTYLAVDNEFDGQKTVSSDSAPMEMECNATRNSNHPPDFQFKKGQSAAPPKSMFGGGSEGINLSAKIPEEDAAAKLANFIRKNFPLPPNAVVTPAAGSDAAGQNWSSKDGGSTGQRITEMISGSAGEHIQYPSPMLKGNGGRSERQRVVNARSTCNKQQQHELILLDDSESEPENQKHASKPSTRSRAFNSSPTHEDCIKKDGQNQQISQSDNPAGVVAGSHNGARTYFPEPDPTQLHYSSGRYHRGRFFYQLPSRTPLLALANQPGPSDQQIVRYGGSWNPRGDQLPNLLPSFIPNIPLPPANPTQGRPIPVVGNRSSSRPVPVPFVNGQNGNRQRYPANYGGGQARSKSISSTTRHTVVMHQNKNRHFTWRPPPANEIQPRSPERPVFTTLVQEGAQRNRRATSVVTSVTRIYQCEQGQPTSQVLRAEHRQEERSISPNARRARAKSMAGDGGRCENAGSKSKNYEMIRASIHQSRTKILQKNTQSNGFYFNNSRSKSCAPNQDLRRPISPVRYPNGSLGALLCRDNAQPARLVCQQSTSNRRDRYRSPSPTRRRGSRELERSRHRSRSRRVTTKGSEVQKRGARCATPFAKRGDGRQRKRSESSSDSTMTYTLSSSSSTSSSEERRSKRKVKKQLSQVLYSLTEKLANKKSSSKSDDRREASRSVAERDSNSRSSNEANQRRVPSAYNELSIYQPPANSSAFDSSRKRSNHKDDESPKKRRRYSSSSSSSDTCSECEKSSGRRKKSHKSSSKRCKRDDRKALLKAVKTIKKILSK